MNNFFSSPLTCSVVAIFHGCIGSFERVSTKDFDSVAILFAGCSIDDDVLLSAGSLLLLQSILSAPSSSLSSVCFVSSLCVISSPTCLGKSGSSSISDLVITQVTGATQFDGILEMLSEQLSIQFLFCLLWCCFLPPPPPFFFLRRLLLLLLVLALPVWSSPSLLFLLLLGELVTSFAIVDVWLSMSSTAASAAAMVQRIRFVHTTKERIMDD
mmetsp:Transcript_34948/g.71350  ORF Transcript_34948/g.71350 Transcript_34948/m.71350 type:complete len:213 (+) Transcript_34948:1311-1949(+)